ncbi:type VII secretion target [Streptomyces sp. WMMB 322]|uniref:type VII secretion target n=1 Tax=Streptomyces sp. WMMB 322 TaxID=1286821 RepID=UPI0006E38A45|nr:type VII secretion target [Streptomyces sp. WMMB 322]
MSAQFEVDPQALRTYAKNVNKEVERIRRVRNKIDQVTLSPGAFGKLPQSDELAKDYEKQRNDSLDDLKDAAGTLEDIVDSVRDTAKAYDQTEDDTNVSFGGQ